MKKKNEPNSTDNPLYHNTWTLLKKYRDVVWSLELSVQQVRNTFEIEYGNTVEEFLDSIYLAGADLTVSAIERHARCIEPVSYTHLDVYKRQPLHSVLLYFHYSCNLS